ncbi:MAG: zinc-ribbon domain-containing protein [Pseudomonadota bacterium]
MRLNCPICEAIYEVPDDAIPPMGREVQCSNCEHRWFQIAAQTSGEPARAPGTRSKDLSPQEAAEAAMETPPPTARSLDPELADVLREEAAREVAARENDIKNVRTPEAEEPETSEIAGGEPSSTADDSVKTEETLESKSTSIVAPIEEQPADKKNNFAKGFMLAILIAGIAAALYVFTPDIIVWFPQLDPYLTAYLDWVGDVRSWLATQF